MVLGASGFQNTEVIIANTCFSNSDFDTHLSLIFTFQEVGLGLIAIHYSSANILALSLLMGIFGKHSIHHCITLVSTSSARRINF